MNNIVKQVVFGLIGSVFMAWLAIEWMAPVEILV